MSLVSTIIPVFNRGRMIVTAVESVWAQDYRPIEILLIDDGSTDDTPQALEELKARSPETITIIRQENSGPGVARETGRRQARGEFIQYLDSDDRLLPGKFTVQVEALQQHPDCDIAYGITRLVDENGITLKEPYKRSGELHDSLFPALLVDRWWNTHTPLYRRSLCDRVGAWPENRMSEDWQYDARCGAIRTKLVFCPQLVSEHVQHSGDRLTRRGLDLRKLQDMAALLPVLHSSATMAGVRIGTPEMQHFSRWAFSLSRQLSVAGDSDAAANCLELARISDKKGGNRLDLRCFAGLVRIFGWKRATSLIQQVFRMMRRSPSSETMPPSWT